MCPDTPAYPSAMFSPPFASPGDFSGGRKTANLANHVTNMSSRLHQVICPGCSGVQKNLGPGLRAEMGSPGGPGGIPGLCPGELGYV